MDEGSHLGSASIKPESNRRGVCGRFRISMDECVATMKMISGANGRGEVASVCTHEVKVASVCLCVAISGGQETFLLFCEPQLVVKTAWRLARHRVSVHVAARKLNGTHVVAIFFNMHVA